MKRRWARSSMDGACCEGCRPSSASVGLTDSSQVDMLGLQYKSVNFGAEASPGAPKWGAQTDCDRARTPSMGNSEQDAADSSPLEKSEHVSRHALPLHVSIWSPQGGRIVIELMPSDRALKASREGSK